MIIAIVQARMGSTRLPGKVMFDVCGRPVLWHIVERLKHSKYIDHILIATTENNDNDNIRSFCHENNLKSYSGSEDDVLDRYYQASNLIGIEQDDIVVRVTADCPLIDPEIVDKIIEMHIHKKTDYTSNTLPPTFPDGLDCEVMQFSALNTAWENAKLKSEREHVTLYIRNHPELFNIANMENDVNISEFRWTLDEPEDYSLIKSIYSLLYKENEMFLTSDILRLFNENPKLKNINSMHIRNEGLLKSLSEDLNGK